MIGIFGGLRFQFNSNRVFTFNKMKRELSGNWNTMDRIGKKPLTEFNGPGLQNITFEIVLDASLGVRPRTLLKTMETMIESGQAHELVIGKKRIGKNQWVITKCSEAWDIILRGGELYRATVTMTLQEYL